MAAACDLPGDFSNPINLFQVRYTRPEYQLVHTDILKPLDQPLECLRRFRERGSNSLCHWTHKAVVVTNVPSCSLVGVGPQAKVGAAHETRFARPAGLFPGLCCDLIALRGHVGSAATRNIARAPSRYAPYCARHIAADENFWSALAGRRRPDGTYFIP